MFRFLKMGVLFVSFLTFCPFMGVINYCCRRRSGISRPVTVFCLPCPARNNAQCPDVYCLGAVVLRFRTLKCGYFVFNTLNSRKITSLFHEHIVDIMVVEICEASCGINFHVLLKMIQTSISLSVHMRSCECVV